MTARIPSPADWLMAVSLSLGVLVLGSALDQREDEIMIQSLSIPATEEGPITAADLQAHRSAKACCSGDCTQVQGCPYRWPAVICDASDTRQWTGVDHECRLWPAEAATEIGFEREGQHRESWITRAWLRFARVLG